MANFLVLDANDKPLNSITWNPTDILDVSGYARIVQYDGPFNPDWTWDNVNKVLVEPPPPEPTPVPAMSGAQEL